MSVRKALAATLNFPEFLELMNQKWHPSLLKDPGTSLTWKWSTPSSLLTLFRVRCRPRS